MNRPLLLLMLVLFYSFLGLIYGLYGSSVSAYNDSDINFISSEYEYDDPDDRKGLVNFFNNVKVTIQETPTWLNIILLVPFSVFFVYLLITAWINPGG